MDSKRPTSLIEHFSVLVDVRDEDKRLHTLIDIIIIAVVVVICGADE